MPRMDEQTFRIWGEYAGGIDAFNLLFAARTLRDVLEALEHNRDFKSDCAVRAMEDCLAHAERIRTLLDHREAYRVQQQLANKGAA